MIWLDLTQLSVKKTSMDCYNEQHSHSLDNNELIYQTIKLKHCIDSNIYFLLRHNTTVAYNNLHAICVFCWKCFKWWKLHVKKIMINSLDYHDDNFKFDNHLCVTNEETHFIFYYLPLF